jgi:multiple sugar transport system substrate-binding protein
MSRKLLTLLLALLAASLVLVACTEVEQAATDIAPTLQAAVEEVAPTLEAAAEELAPTLEAAATEVTEAVEEAMEEPMDEGPCAPATEGPLAGVDPRGLDIEWWHNHSGSRDKQLQVLVSQFNATNECIELDDNGQPVLLPANTDRVLYDFVLDAEGNRARDEDGNLLLAETSLAGQPKRLYVRAINQGSYNDIRDKVNASAAAGEQPSALVVGYQNDQAFYQLNESLVDLETYLNDPYWGLSAEEIADFYPSFFDQSIHPVFDNQRLGFPPNRSMEVLFYNQTWLEELGFAGPPTTPDEFREMACAAAEANGDGTGGYILRDDASAVAAWTFAYGGDVLTEDGTGYVYDGDPTVQAMAFLKQMLDDGCAYFFTEGFPNPEFAARRAIFAQGSSSGIPFYEGDVNTVAEQAGRAPDVWGVAAIPHTTPEPVQNIYGGDVMITNSSPEQQLAAWIFIKWFTSPEIMAEWDIISGYFPTRAGAEEFLSGYIDDNPQWGQAVDMLPYSYYEPQLISYQSTRDAAEMAFNEIMQLPAGWTEDDIREILTTLTATANEYQEELMEEVQ